MVGEISHIKVTQSDSKSINKRRPSINDPLIRLCWSMESNVADTVIYVIKYPSNIYLISKYITINITIGINMFLQKTVHFDIPRIVNNCPNSILDKINAPDLIHILVYKLL